MATTPAPAPVTPRAGREEINFETSIKIIGGLLAALVAAYTLIDNSNKSYAAIDQQTRSELDHWEGLRSQYFQIIESLGDNYSAPKEAEKLQLDSLCRLAKAAPSTLEGRAVRKVWGIGDTAYKQKKVDEIADARSHLVEIIYKYPPARELPSCSGLFDELRQDQAEKVAASETGPQPPAATAAETAAKVAADNSAVEKAVIQATDQSQPEALRKQVPSATFTLSKGGTSGYNVDVFWCARPLDQPAETQIFLTAQAVAKILGEANPATSGLGRIRLRPLSVENQANPGYPSSGFQVRSEALEQPMQARIIALLASAPQLPRFAPYVSKSVTPKYLSVFVCSAPPNS